MTTFKEKQLAMEIAEEFKQFNNSDDYKFTDVAPFLFLKIAELQNQIDDLKEKIK